MLKLYGGARSRASIVQWYLEELEMPYEFVTLNLQTGEHRQPEFCEINPFAKVPAIIDGDLKLWESGAILLYLLDRYGNADLNDRAIAAQWVLFANATLGPGIFVEANREREMPRLMQPLNEIFGKREFIAGDRFTVSDVAVGSILAYIPLMLRLDLSEYANVMNYMKRMAERLAFQKALPLAHASAINGRK